MRCWKERLDFAHHVWQQGGIAQSWGMGRAGFGKDVTNVAGSGGGLGRFSRGDKPIRRLEGVVGFMWNQRRLAPVSHQIPEGIRVARYCTARGNVK